MSLNFNKIQQLADSTEDVVFPGEEDEENPFTVTFKVLTPKRIEAIIKKHTKTTRKGNQRIKDIDDRDAMEAIIDEAVQGWTGLLDQSNTEVQCSKEMKIELVDSSADILSWFTDEIDRLSNTAARSREVSEKNSVAS